MFEPITITEWLRVGLLYSHLGLCIFAISAILKADMALFMGKITRSEIGATAKSISTLLFFLWVTGLTIIYIDTGFELAVLMSKSKLLIKLMCVVTLTLNGLLLHYMSFPVLTKNEGNLTANESLLLTVTGSLSSSHWLLAAFIGISKPLGRLPFSTLFSVYVIFVGMVILISLFFIPLLSRLSPFHIWRRRADD